MKKVLVMGGSYFIGRKIVEVFKDSNYDITVLNRGTKEEMPGIRHIKCDRNHEEEMGKLLREEIFDIIIDVCGLNSNQAKILLQSVNTTKLQRIIFISSSSVYDIENLSPPFKENDALGYNSYWKDYGQNKIEAEAIYKKFAKANSISLVILRPPYVYGENNYAQRESFIFDHIENDKPIIVPSADYKLQFIYSGDLANIVSCFAKMDKMPMINIFNVGNKNELTATEWITECSKAANKKAKILYYDHISHRRHIRDFFPFYDYDNYLDVNLVNKHYNVETSMYDGLRHAYDWYKSQKNTIHFKENVSLNEIEILKESKSVDEPNI